MSLSTLMPELLSTIFGYLDKKSIFNLYESTTCTNLRNAILMHGLPGVLGKKDGVITKCQFSLNSLATAKSFHSNFFRDICGHLQSLNLSGVNDLNLTNLTEALSCTPNLIELDVSYSNIIITDFLSIVKVRPTLRSIAINVVFKDYDWNFNKSDLIIQYQNAFEQFETVQFVVIPDDFSYYKLLICMLEKAKLSCFKFVFIEPQISFHYVDFEDGEWNLSSLNWPHFQLYFLNGVFELLKMPIFSLLDIKNYEVVIFSNCNTETLDTQVYATELLGKFIKEKFGIPVERVPFYGLYEIEDNLCSSAGQNIFLFWDNRCTEFNSDFYSKLTAIVKENLVFNFDSPLTVVPTQYAWYNVEEMVGDQGAPEIVEFDYSDSFKAIDKIKLNIFANFDHIDHTDNLPKMMISNNDFIAKLKHLSLRSNMEYHPDFFKNLFERGKYLETLQLDIEVDDFDPDYFRFVKRSASLKNIYLEASEIQFDQFFEHLSGCKSIENIFFMNGCSVDSLPDPTALFTGCDNLYNLGIQRVSNENLIQYYKSVRYDLGKHAINIDFNINNKLSDEYNPYISVFRLFKLKPEAFIHV